MLLWPKGKRPSKIDKVILDGFNAGPRIWRKYEGVAIFKSWLEYEGYTIVPVEQEQCFRSVIKKIRNKIHAYNRCGKLPKRLRDDIRDICDAALKDDIDA